MLHAMRCLHLLFFTMFEIEFNLVSVTKYNAVAAVSLNNS